MWEKKNISGTRMNERETAMSQSRGQSLMNASPHHNAFDLMCHKMMHSKQLSLQCLSLFPNLIWSGTHIYKQVSCHSCRSPRPPPGPHSYLLNTKPREDGLECPVYLCVSQAKCQQNKVSWGVAQTKDLLSTGLTGSPLMPCRSIKTLKGSGLLIFHLLCCSHGTGNDELHTAACLVSARVCARAHVQSKVQHLHVFVDVTEWLCASVQVSGFW